MVGDNWSSNASMGTPNISAHGNIVGESLEGPVEPGQEPEVP